MSRAWTPDAGDVVWVHFDPQVGHEQAGHRPAVVLTPASYNDRSGLLLCVPLTTHIKGYPFEVPIAATGKAWRWSITSSRSTGADAAPAARAG